MIQSLMNILLQTIIFIVQRFRVISNHCTTNFSERSDKKFTFFSLSLSLSQFLLSHNPTPVDQRRVSQMFRKGLFVHSSVCSVSTYCWSLGPWPRSSFSLFSSNSLAMNLSRSHPSIQCPPQRFLWAKMNCQEQQTALCLSSLNRHARCYYHVVDDRYQQIKFAILRN